MKRGLLAINQSTSVLFRDVVDAFADAGVDVALVVGELEVQDGYRPRYEVIRGCGLRKSPAWRRVWTWGRFTWQALRAMRRHRDRFALLVTNPPTVPWVGPLARRLFGVRYGVLVYDIYPDVMERMGLLKAGGLVARMLRRLSAASYRKAECVITLGRHMAETVRRQLPAGESLEIEIIPNWADVEFIKPVARQENPFAREHGLLDKFVVMYSGAFGATHNIGSIVTAAERLRDLSDVHFVLIGGGTREEEVRRLVAERALPNLTLLPYQPIEMVPYSLTSADCHLVSLDEGYEGLSMPSKTYTALAAGAAILGMSSPGTELTELIQEYTCGVSLLPRDDAALVEAIRHLHSDRQMLARLKANARRAAEEHYSAPVCTAQYLQTLRPLLDRSTPDGPG